MTLPWTITPVMKAPTIEHLVAACKIIDGRPSEANYSDGKLAYCNSKKSCPYKILMKLYHPCNYPCNK